MANLLQETSKVTHSIIYLNLKKLNVQDYLKHLFKFVTFVERDKLDLRNYNIFISFVNVYWIKVGSFAPSSRFYFKFKIWSYVTN